MNHGRGRSRRPRPRTDRYGLNAYAMEAASIPAAAPLAPRVRAMVSNYGLIVVLLALPVYFADPRPGDDREPRRDWAQNLVAGISNGVDLGAGGDRLHARLRHRRADQLRPRRRVHARLVHLRLVLRRRSAWHEGQSAVVLFFGLLLTLVVAMARRRLAQRADRAGGLPTVAIGAQAGAADHRGRHVLHPARTSACCGTAARRSASTDLINAQHTCSTIFGVTIENGDVLAGRGDDPAAAPDDDVHQPARGSARRCAPPRRTPRRRG